MNKGYKNFNGGLADDLDIDRVDDFVNQVSYNPSGLFDFLDDDDIKVNPSLLASENNALDSDGDGIPDMIDVDAGSGTGLPTYTMPLLPTAQDTQEKLEKRRRSGAGLGAFAKGLGQGLGLLQNQQQPLPQQSNVDYNAPAQAGFTKERQNPFIPILIGLIGVGVIFIAIKSTKKGGQDIAVPAPTPAK